MTRARFLALLLGGVAIEGCSHKKTRVAQTPPPPTPDLIQSTPPPPTHLSRDRRPPALPSDTAPETGVASWYGHPYHGRASASGEIYDMEQMTAAHRTLPFNTWVASKISRTGMTVDVRIIDRGPFVGGRISTYPTPLPAPSI